MKKMKSIILLSIGLAIFSYSCSKSVHEKQEIIPQYSIVESNSWEVDSANFIDELLAGMELAEEMAPDDLARIELHISHSIDGKFTFNQILFDNPNPPVFAVVCAGTGYSFAKCVKDYLDGHPNGCLVIRSDGEGGYTASDDC